MAELKRPTKREIGEALDVLKKEESQLRAWGIKWQDNHDDYYRKLAGQRLRKSDRLAKVIAWIEGIANAR